MLNFDDLIINDKEDVLHVIQELTYPCYDCRLGKLQGKKHNRGLIWRGKTTATIAGISIMPGRSEMESGKPFTGRSGKELDKWFKSIGLDTNVDLFITNIVQCKPPEVQKKSEEKPSQRQPELDEIAICFPSRCLRILRSLPNLEVVITLGLDAAQCLLGDSPKENTHLGHFFTTNLLPNVAVFCLPHPSSLLRDNNKNDEKKWRIIKYLERFKRQYLDTNGKIKELATNPHNKPR